MSGPVWITLYRLLLLAVAFVAVGAILASGPGLIAAFLLTTLLAALWTDDILQILSDVWNANFWTINR